MGEYLPWAILILHILILLGLDFLVFQKKHRSFSNKTASWETLFFVLNALAFVGIIYWAYSNNIVGNINNLTAGQSVIKYLTAYFIELSLSIDNLFVIAIIFSTYRIPRVYQHKLLFLGILGAIIFRGILIGVGLVLIHKISGITILFGLFLLYTAFKMLKKENEEEELEQSKGLVSFFKISNKFDGAKFWTIIKGNRVYTPLFGALITIEVTDLIFALDSIPAVFAVTTDPFIIFSSNIFAIMGLRSMYYFLANMLEKFIYLKYSIFSILIFVSIKLVTANFLEIPEGFSLLFIAVSLIIGIWISVLNVQHKQ